MNTLIIDKIKKLLALASSSNPNEAAAALSKARELMNQYGIPESDLRLSDIDRFSVGRNGKTPPKWEVHLIYLISSFFQSRFLMSQYRDHSDWMFVGIGAAPEISAYAFTVLIRKIKSDRTNYIRRNLSRCKLPSKTRRADDFCIAWVDGLAEKLIFPENATLAGLLDDYISAAVTEELKPIDRFNNTLRFQDRVVGYAAGQKAELLHGVGSQAERLQIG